MSEGLKQTPLYQHYVDASAKIVEFGGWAMPCLLYTSPSPRDGLLSRMPSSA